jgi:hypothetical protein
MELSVYVVHSKTACPERREWCKTLLSDVREQLVSHDIDCKLMTVTDSNDSRLDKHMSVLRSSSKSKACVLVLEDDTILMVDIGKTTTAFHKSQDDIWYLTPTCTAYLVKPDAINRLLECCTRTKVEPKCFRDVTCGYASRMCFRTRVLVDVCQDGSHVGIWVPTLVADKVCTADAPKMFSVSSTSRWAAVRPHPHTALRYAQALRNAGDIRGSRAVCDAAIEKFRNYPDTRGDTNLLTFAIELHRPTAVC